MKLASLKGPTRDGSLLLVNENLTRAVSVLDIAPNHAIRTRTLAPGRGAIVE